MATTPAPKSTSDKIIDIIHNLISGGGSNSDDDPVSQAITDASNNSLIGGGYRRARIDDAEQKSVNGN